VPRINDKSEPRSQSALRELTRGASHVDALASVSRGVTTTTVQQACEDVVYTPLDAMGSQQVDDDVVNALRELGIPVSVNELVAAAPPKPSPGTTHSRPSPQALLQAGVVARAVAAANSDDIREARITTLTAADNETHADDDAATAATAATAADDDDGNSAANDDGDDDDDDTEHPLHLTRDASDAEVPPQHRDATGQVYQSASRSMMSTTSSANAADDSLQVS
jgi:hypothetical protein